MSRVEPGPRAPASAVCETWHVAPLHLAHCTSPWASAHRFIGSGGTRFPIRTHLNRRSDALGLVPGANLALGRTDYLICVRARSRRRWRSFRRISWRTYPAARGPSPARVRSDEDHLAVRRDVGMLHHRTVAARVDGERLHAATREEFDQDLVVASVALGRGDMFEPRLATVQDDDAGQRRTCVRTDAGEMPREQVGVLRRPCGGHCHRSARSPYRGCAVVRGSWFVGSMRASDLRVRTPVGARKHELRAERQLSVDACAPGQPE